MAEAKGPARPAGPVESEHDGRLVRHVRWQLLAWTTVSSLAVLVVLGVALYAAVASTLGSSSEELLRERASLVRDAQAVAPATEGPGGAVTVVSTSEAAMPGLAVGGPYSGTMVVILGVGAVTPVQPGGSPGVLPPGSMPVFPSGSPVSSGQISGAVRISPQLDPVGYESALLGETSIHEVNLDGSPVRVLSMPIDQGGTRAVLQVIGDRAAEVRTLGVLLTVLVGGGLIALLVSVGLGYLYAARALVPIRESLRHQREFAADTSHELRTPLAVIRSSVEYLRRHPEDQVRDVAATLDDIEGEATRVGSLVDDLLLLARTDAYAAELERNPVDLADLAADALAALQPLAAGRGTRLELDVEPAPIVGDAVRLRRLVTILADNGLRHGRPGGTVRVVVRPGASLVVEDDGPGIRPEDLPHVFDRFWRAPGAAAGGSGLGLAIARWIAEHHGGRIVVAARDGGGASFRVSLPER